MRRDIDEALSDWPYDPTLGEYHAREVRARDGRLVLQARIELGILQIETEGRPDGVRPHGMPTYLDYLRYRSSKAKARGGSSAGVWTMSPEHCVEADREFIQYYHRRMAWLAVSRYDKAIEDADHTLALMDFVNKHGMNDEYKMSHERYRGLVLFHRTQAAVASALAKNRPEESIDAVLEGREKIAKHHKMLSALLETDETLDERMIEQLVRLEEKIRENYSVGPTLREQLDDAVAREDYERAAALRDQIRAQTSGR
jgi:hypothetical protein